ncbi:MAG: single-stranded-DNA-specific exonuclease RecJ [Alphaproteobacteria bacterium]|nr:single-stranded-DNA-specific exonuclease RecJ [Alphaproteobacteria bacterium]MBU1513680.1 single-stranded-DNA-specific exonuclease RecJ [Alphaproteobacteria bacterium]MBU2094675.1 single-stranded-DNA-specific exonuclease RecJ [Alphaproteobacteria bacterium]MBU2150256.1 single-stranded-DNA-specific exonuclease RecJ [Alphaproteobacteria bacterium]MBU2309215.1 single-stranded-DNA-specific exonuclease RecJ [Alphaproteobacteria bacterium]
MADGSANVGFLGVTRSLSGRLWRQRAADPEVTRHHQLNHGLSELLARALSSRGVSAAAGADFLNPTLKALFPDPSSFADMDRAAEILVDALEAKRRVVVFADYDVDGASSAALIVRWFRVMGLELSIYVPDRIVEGYGPSPAVFRHLKAEGAELVITVDCGAAALDALACAAEIGLPVVVIDHHLMRPGEIPAVAALVNPNRPDCQSGQGHLAAAGVSFVLLAALSREARKRGLMGGGEPDIKSWLDLAAMGAVCDVTQLTGFNRALTAQGLKVMSGWANPGLKALMEVAKGQGPATVFHVGFLLGPRINAGGRIGRSDLGARLLSTDDPAEAAELAAELDGLNASRKDVEREVQEAAVAHIERESNQADAPCLVVAADGWHPGVIGIVAGRLRERYRKPVIVIGIDRAADVGKGSGRSQPGVNLGRAVQAAYEEGLLLAGGGHAMAAGLSVRPDTIPELRAFLCERMAAEAEIAAAEDGLEIDALVTTRGADRGLWTDFQRLAPFGPGNPEPTFAAADVRVERPMALRGGHVRCTLTDGSGGRLKAVAWRVEDTEAGRRLMQEGGAVHVAGRLKPDDWQGREGVELEIEDVADPRRA